MHWQERRPLKSKQGTEYLLWERVKQRSIGRTESGKDLEAVGE